MVVNVRLEHFYGPSDSNTNFITYLAKQLLAQEPCISLTPGQQRRSFIYIDDVLAAYDIFVNAALPPGFREYTVASEELWPLKDVVELMKRLAGNTVTELRFGALPYRDGEYMESQIDLSALKPLGWRPRVSLEEGLKRVIGSLVSRVQA